SPHIITTRKTSSPPWSKRFAPLRLASVLLPDALVTNLNFGPNSVQINAAPGMDANAVYNLFVEGVRMQSVEFQKAVVRLGHGSCGISSTSSRPLRIRMFAEPL